MEKEFGWLDKLEETARRIDNFGMVKPAETEEVEEEVESEDEDKD